jgi:streptomycin 6-kinase
MLRNPVEYPEFFAHRDIVRRRIERFANTLNLDARRILKWNFAQAILAAVWLQEDGMPIRPDNPFLRLADEMRPMLKAEQDL